jgi:hypothetical protein
MNGIGLTTRAPADGDGAGATTRIRHVPTLHRSDQIELEGKPLLALHWRPSKPAAMPVNMPAKASPAPRRRR